MDLDKVKYWIELSNYAFVGEVMPLNIEARYPSHKQNRRFLIRESLQGIDAENKRT